MAYQGQERRRSARYLCSQLVEITVGGTRRLTAVLEDLSPEGAAVAVEEPLEAGTTVELSAGHFQAKAQVRYCDARETDYRLGLEFVEGSRWQPSEWEPEHLFLPPRA